MFGSARYACQNRFFSLFLSIRVCWIKKMQVPFFSTTPSSSILNFKMAAIFIIFLSYFTCSSLHKNCLALHIHEFSIKKRHKMIFCITWYQRKINSQLKSKIAAKWALSKVWFKIFELFPGANYEKIINIESVSRVVFLNEWRTKVDLLW